MSARNRQLEFVHCKVTNLWRRGSDQEARKTLEELGGATYIQQELATSELEDAVTTRDSLADIALIWWKLTGNDWARITAQELFRSNVGFGGWYEVHATYVLAYLTASVPPTTDEIRAQVRNLRNVRHLTTDDETANRLADMAQHLGELYFRRCHDENSL
jgi:hypothetical protein